MTSKGKGFTWTAQGLGRALRESLGADSIEVSIWGPDLLAVRMDWPATTAALARITRGLRRELKHGEFNECHFAPDPSQFGALMVFDRGGAWKDAQALWNEYKEEKPRATKGS